MRRRPSGSASRGAARRPLWEGPCSYGALGGLGVLAVFVVLLLSQIHLYIHHGENTDEELLLAAAVAKERESLESRVNLLQREIVKADELIARMRNGEPRPGLNTTSTQAVTQGWARWWGGGSGRPGGSSFRGGGKGQDNGRPAGAQAHHILAPARDEYEDKQGPGYDGDAVDVQEQASVVQGGHGYGRDAALWAEAGGVAQGNQAGQHRASTLLAEFASGAHHILGLGDEDFRASPVDELMGQYDTDKCDSSFGNGLVKQWRSKGKTYCGHAAESRATSITCHLMHQANHAGSGDNLCHMKNVMIDLGVYKDKNAASNVMRRYRDSRQSDEAYVHHAKGTVQGTCQPAAALWKDRFFPGWNADWTTKAYSTVADLRCEEWVNHKVLIVQRHTFANFFHDSEDFINAFLALAILRWNTKDTQVFLTDLYPKGPFWPMWEKVFSGDHPPMMAWDLGERFGGKRVCFRDAAVGIFGPAAPTTLARMVTPCFHTALVRAYADQVVRGLELQGVSRYAEAPSEKVVVTWMARRSSVQWPERQYCSEDGLESHFTCNYFQHMGIRELQRKVKNDGDVVRALRRLESRKFDNGAKVEFRDVDYNLLRFEDQLRNDVETDIMVGPHGAGLYHIVFTADRAVLIELKIDGTGGRKHFDNLARWSGHKYVSASPSNPVHVDTVVGLVAKAVSNMDLSKH